MELLTFDKKKNKMVKCGDIEGDTFYREVKPEHFMRVVGGYGIQSDAFEYLVKSKVFHVLLINSQNPDKFKSRIDDWIIHGKTADYGHGKQRFLSLKFMKRIIPIKKKEVPAGEVSNNRQTTIF